MPRDYDAPRDPEKVDISGLDKAELVAALHANSRSQGMGVLQDTGPLSADEIRDLESQRPEEYRYQYDYLRGRVMKVNLSGDEVDPYLYDRDLGQGALARVVARLRGDSSATERPLVELGKLILDQTRCFRKGEPTTEEDIQVGDRTMRVITINGYPEREEDDEAIDVHFLLVGFRNDDKAAFIEAIRLAVTDKQSYQPTTLDRLAGGPSYIELGAWLGSQDLALRFIALGQHYDMWQAVTPALLGIEGDDANMMAGNGFVMMSGLKSEDFPEAFAGV